MSGHFPPRTYKLCLCMDLINKKSNTFNDIRRSYPKVLCEQIPSLTAVIDYLMLLVADLNEGLLWDNCDNMGQVEMFANWFVNLVWRKDVEI